MSIDYISPDLDGDGLRIGIVQARFNDYAGQALAGACIEELLALGVDEDDITHLTVPGALEVPLALAKLASTEDFDALVAVGAVVRGETYHFEIVSNESAAGIARVSLDTGVPIANAILTCENDEQVRARMLDKGRDAARVAVEMANLLWSLDEAGEEIETGEAGDLDDDATRVRG
ncbi:MAG: 6,7-dimethyl-8-ribityllumazine synthase [Burkholderiaceae bacterium]|jgi:6,7-dimethyl-8-ribityllumazine synthase|nr:6,7-dimethyl-8-ribityllumazine synthase [Burkholderiaceae bacterium]